MQPKVCEEASLGGDVQNLAVEIEEELHPSSNSHGAGHSLAQDRLQRWSDSWQVHSLTFLTPVGAEDIATERSCSCGAWPRTS